MTRIRKVAPSGDTSGATDAVAIQAAIDALVTNTTTTAPGIVVLTGGRYYINKTIYVNTRATTAYKRISIEGLGASRVDVTSTFTGTYAFEIYGTITRAPVMNGVDIYCANLCRGVLVFYQPYCELLTNCYILYTKEIALDCIDCWGSQLRNVYVHYARGVGFRGWRFNSSSITDCKFHGFGCRNSKSSDNNAAMWLYDCLNGRAAAMTLYDGSDEELGTYLEDWPAVDDEYVTDSSGSLVQITEARRSQVMLQGNEIFVRNINLETSAFCSYPSIYLEAHNVSIHGIRMEASYNNPTMFVVEGLVSAGRNITFEQIHYRNAPLLGDGNKQHVVTVRSQSSCVRVADSQLRGFGGNIIYAESGDHTQATVERVFTEANVITAENYLGAAVGANITDAVEIPTP